MATSWNKKERENKKKQERKKKEEKKQLKKEQPVKKKDLSDMMAYLDENGNLTSVEPDPSKRIEINAEDIDISTPSRRNEEVGPLTGRITFFNDTKGFGFIESEDMNQKVFVHQSASEHPLKEGHLVEFEVEKGVKGLSAVNVVIKK